MKYFFKDYVIKKPYKEIKYFGEFQQELLYALPHAYWHFQNGTLATTKSSLYTAPFYFFSPNHEEKYISRKWKGNYNINFPNGPHNHKLNKIKWKKVPLKKIFKNSTYIFKKPLLIIANRYNYEWNEEPISFFDLETLQKMIHLLSDKYQIIYNRPGEEYIVNDNSEIQELGDKEWIKNECKDVILLSDIYERDKEELSSFNELQLKVYANCSNFISIHGGTATLASYFGGKNIIFSKKGHEHYLDEFNKIFTEVAGTSIFHVVNEEELMDNISTVFTEERL